VNYFGLAKNYLLIERHLKILVYYDRKTPKREELTIKEQGWLRMEKIYTDCSNELENALLPFRDHPPHRLFDAPSASSFPRSSLGIVRVNSGF